ncbi:MAG: C-GCAxxG-C-C family protein [Bacteroidales bacterium]|nr:C-GCAxxG-C-C family protein [Bacteroidales bacterium]
MESNNIEELAVSLKHNGRNCCQAVTEALTAGDDTLPISQEALNMLAAGFRTGMGGMEGPCGALSGAVMIAGLRSKGGAEATGMARLIHQKFTELSGASICKILKSRTPEGNVLCDCDTCVRNGVKAYMQAKAAVN